MKVSDYIVDFLQKQGVQHVFLITGGAIAFVVDAFSRRRDISYVCVAHEQAGAMMAESYARLGKGLGAAMTTSGPGATNLITGIGCAWFDSIPTLFITGQVNTYELKGAQKGTKHVRQVGFQETEIVDIVQPITKLAVQIKRAEDIRYIFEKATYIATSGRPGPVLIDVPMDFQRVEIDPKKLTGFTPPVKKPYRDTGKSLQKKIKTIVRYMKRAKRPVFLAGGGIRIADAGNEAHILAKTLKFPVVASWSGFDLFAYTHPYYIGNHGVYGARSANFTVQNSDFLLSIGSRLDTRQTGGKPETFAREATIVMVDIDKAELDKRRGLTPTISIQCDAKEFLIELYARLKREKLPDTSAWLKTCLAWKETYPTVLPQYYKEKKYVNAYVFVQTLSEELGPDAVVIPDDGGHLTWTMQAFKLKQGQRLFSAFGNSPMGYSFPAAIGAAIALKKKEVICIDGDGSLQMNIQELQTLAYLKLPVKIFVLNNQGYGIIKQFQELYLESRYEATGKGVTVPDFIKVGNAYGLKTVSIVSHTHLRQKIKEVLAHAGPVLCDVRIPDHQKLNPKLEFGKPIEDLSPLLPREEFHKNMIVKPIEEKVVERSKSTEIN